MLMSTNPLFFLLRRHVRTAHKTPRRIRLKCRVLKQPRLNVDYLEAYLAATPGVTMVRINPKAGCVAVRHEGIPNVEDVLAEALSKAPFEVFEPGPKRPPRISRPAVAAHLLVAAAIPLAAPVLQLPLALLVGIPVIASGALHLLRNGITAKSLDAVSMSLCLALRSYGAAGVIAFMRLFGDYLKQANDRRSNDLLKSLLRTDQSSLWVERGGVEIEIPFADAVPGDVVVCGPGELITVDGVVASGRALLNKSLITGESLPVYVETGDAVVSGSLVETGTLRVTARKVGVDTAMSRLNAFLEKAARDKSLPELKGDVLADRLAPLSIGLGAGAFALTGDLARAASTASIDYVCSVKFPAGFSVKSSMYAAGRRGVLLKGGSALDALAKVDAVVFDKTGTLTTNTLVATEVVPAPGRSRKEVLTLAARLEQHYRHPVAAAVLAEARRLDLPLAPVGEVDFFVSNGVRAKVNGKTVRVGGRGFIAVAKGPGCAFVDAAADRLRAGGDMALFVSCDGKMLGVIGLRAMVRPEAETAIRELRELGVKKVVVLTGDHPKTAVALTAGIRGVDAVHCGLGPEDKAQAVNELKKRGYCVAVVGDGVNDAPALECADLGVCMSHGGDLARASARAVILNNDLRALCEARRIAMRQHKILDHCFRQGFVVNSLLLGLASLGMLSPLAAAALHNVNTLSLVGYAAAAAAAPPSPASAA